MCSTEYLGVKLIFSFHKGTCWIPIKYAPDKALGKWAEKIRRENNKMKRGETSDYLTADRLRKLVTVGFVFDQAKGETLPWEERFEMLKAYRQEHGEDPKTSHEMLGRWVTIQVRPCLSFHWRPDAFRHS